jgi:hypothetical protein
MSCSKPDALVTGGWASAARHRLEVDTVASKDRLRATELIVGKLPGREQAGAGRGFRRDD